MKNTLIEEQLKKVENADLSNYDPETNTYIIPKREDIKIDEDNCYLVRLKKSIYNNVIKINWNNGKEFPTYEYLKIDVSKKMGKMIKVVGIGYDIQNQTDITGFWSGWLSLDDLEIIKKL